MCGFYATRMSRFKIYNNLEYFNIRGTEIYDVFIAHRHDI